MNRFVIILAALVLGACTTQVAEEQTGSVRHRDGTRYVGQDDLGTGDPGSQKIKHMGFGAFGPNTNPASTKQGPFPEPWQERQGPFPEPWEDDGSGEPAPADPDTN